MSVNLQIIQQIKYVTRIIIWPTISRTNRQNLIDQILSRIVKKIPQLKVNIYIDESIKLLLLINLSYLMACWIYFIKQKGKNRKKIIDLINAAYCIPADSKRYIANTIRRYSGFKNIGYYMPQHHFFGVYVCAMLYLFKFLFSINLERYVKHHLVSDTLLYILYLSLLYIANNIIYILTYVSLHKIYPKFIKSHAIFLHNNDNNINNSRQKDTLDRSLKNNKLITGILGINFIQITALVFILNQANMQSYAHIFLYPLPLCIIFYISISISNSYFKN